MEKAITFEDVLMVPKYNPFLSRGDERISTSVSLGSFEFDIPIISANMDTITGVEMAKKMSKLGGLGILHRFCSIEDNVKMFLETRNDPYYRALDKNCPQYPKVGVSVGVNEGLERAKALYNVGAEIFCVDVAHGHSKSCGQMVKELRQAFGKNILIIAGNVCTYAGADYLASCGADVIKVGIGGGCFIPDSQVRTDKGLKSIQHIEIGDKVQTHTGQFQEVIALFNRPIFSEDGEDIIQVNNIHCTQNHEFYVVDKSKKDIVTEENITKHAYWVPASELDKTKHLLVELENE